MTLRKSYDYVVVGAGSAGCAVAARLSEDPDVRVLLLEAGPRDRSLFIHMPAGFEHLMGHATYDWRYESEPEPHLDGRRIKQPRGRVLGGSSSINGMAFVRGHPRDFEAWGALPGCTGWGYADVLPYFRRMETWSGGENTYRGGAGPVKVQRPETFSTPLPEAFIEAGDQAGYVFSEDMNGPQQEGFARFDRNTGDGRRMSSATAYLAPARGRPNLEIAVNCRVAGLDLSGNRVRGVSFLRDGRPTMVEAEREVVMCAGAVDTPRLMMLSGIGDADALARHGIATRHHLPGVGQNLQDHGDFYVQYECREPVTLYSAKFPLKKAMIGLEWILARSGWGATNHFEAVSFIESHPKADYADVQNTFIPIAVSYDGSQAVEGHGFALGIGPMRPTSVGTLSLRSADPAAPAKLAFNYLETGHDRMVARESLRRAREIVAQPAFDRFRGREVFPGPDAKSDRDLDAFLRARLESGYHPCGTCRMGDDALAVVDMRGKVHGMEGLRVGDVSILPRVLSANLNAPAMMIGERIADFAKGEVLPPAAGATFYEGRSRR